MVTMHLGALIAPINPEHFHHSYTDSTGSIELVAYRVNVQSLNAKLCQFRETLLCLINELKLFDRSGRIQIGLQYVVLNLTKPIKRQ